MKTLMLSVCAASIALGFSAGAAQAEFSRELMYNFETGKWNDVDGRSRARERVERDIDEAILGEEEYDHEADAPRQRARQRSARQPRPAAKVERRSTRRAAPTDVVERGTRRASRAAAIGGGRFVRRTGSAAASGSGQVSGIASYYWQPQRVASGGWFNPNAMTAAHKTLPFGTRVRVTHARTGRSVEVTINDRGPFVRGRVIDLSRAAAAALGMRSAGLAPVKIDVIGR
ncbi:MAG TPA: septal ring lytic transglycosylase RlpA family protein [Hyphomicrobiaceae bacterium]|nr:septal ring lytic transglycosylase RlpA family protein [Hyphomicrobiaceae bacterium]